jgi:cytochrome c oxidase assembly protein subunit 15
MASSRAFTLAARLATTTAVLMFGLIVVGSVVRTTGSGLSCPDWPLCQGHLIPPFQFNVFMEWLHRLIALCVGLLLFVTAGTIVRSPETRGPLGGMAALAIALYLSQALLGALTVWKLLDPSVVSGHLAVGLLLFSTLLAIGLIARAHAAPARRALPAGASGLRAWFALATLAIYSQAVLGGVVSTNGAGIACPDWPTCRGEWFPAMQGLVGLQMAHRWTAYALAALLVVLALRARPAVDPVVARIARVLLGIACVQMIVGVFNVLLGIRVWLSALHLANAAAMLALSITATFRLATRPAPRAVLVAEATT